MRYKINTERIEKVLQEYRLFYNDKKRMVYGIKEVEPTGEIALFCGPYTDSFDILELNKGTIEMIKDDGVYLESIETIVVKILHPHFEELFEAVDDEYDYDVCKTFLCDLPLGLYIEINGDVYSYVKGGRVKEANLKEIVNELNEDMRNNIDKCENNWLKNILKYNKNRLLKK